jgi:hypothetical protein
VIVYPVAGRNGRMALGEPVEILIDELRERVGLRGARLLKRQQREN